MGPNDWIFVAGLPVLVLLLFTAHFVFLHKVRKWTDEELAFDTEEAQEASERQRRADAGPEALRRYDDLLQLVRGCQNAIERQRVELEAMRFRISQLESNEDA